MVGGLYTIVTGLDISMNMDDQDYGHPHYTERFDLLLLEDLKSVDEESRKRGKMNLSATVSFVALTHEAKSQLMMKWIETLANTDSQRIATLERSRLLRKQVASSDFASVVEDFSDVTALYQLLVDSLFSVSCFKALGFSRTREGLYVLLALFKAHCSRKLRDSDMSLSITPEVLEESLTSWWHGGIGRFTFKGTCKQQSDRGKLLVVFSSLGSGLARPEWGGTLEALAPVEGVLDVLHVLDPSFSWYQQDPTCTWKGKEYYRNRLQELTSSYDGVMYLGDSMGGQFLLYCLWFFTCMVSLMIVYFIF
jgi:hypothetical protein